jgi:Tol biopolymer transport system component
VLGGGVAAIVVVGLVGLLALRVADERLNPDVDPAPLPTATLAPPDPSDPRIPDGSIAFDSDRSGTFEIYTMTAGGTEVHALTDDAGSDAFWPRISPDRTRILFYRVPAGVHNTRGEYQETELWVMRADGSGETLLLPRHAHGWHQHGHAEWSPDGTSLVMFAGRTTNPQILVTDADGRNPRAVTDEPGTNVDPAWSPDGATIVYAGCPQRVCLPADQEIYTVPAGGGPRTRLTDDGVRDHDPYYSPDGRSIAFLSQTARADDAHPAGVWNIRLMATDGSKLRRLTDDEHINSKPAWSADGTTIYFHRLVYGRGDGFQVWAVDVSDGDLREVTRGHPGINEYPGT